MYKEKAYTRGYVIAYNRISGNSVDCVSEIPDEALSYLTKIPIRQLLTPMIIELLNKGRSKYQIARQLGIPDQFVRYVGLTIGVYKVNN